MQIWYGINIIFGVGVESAIAFGWLDHSQILLCF